MPEKMTVWYNNQMEKLIPVTLITEDNKFHESSMSSAAFLETRDMAKNCLAQGEEEFIFRFDEETSGKVFIVSDILITIYSFQK